MTLKTTRRRVLMAGTAAGATIAMPWIAKAAPEFQFKYANNSPVAHSLHSFAGANQAGIEWPHRDPDLPQ